MLNEREVRRRCVNYTVLLLQMSILIFSLTRSDSVGGSDGVVAVLTTNRVH